MNALSDDRPDRPVSVDAHCQPLRTCANAGEERVIHDDDDENAKAEYDQWRPPVQEEDSEDDDCQPAESKKKGRGSWLRPRRKEAGEKKAFGQERGTVNAGDNAAEEKTPPERFATEEESDEDDPGEGLVKEPAPSKSKRIQGVIEGGDLQ